MLKQWLSLLLSKFYSKQESALVARQSLPDTSEYVDWSSSAVVGKQGTYICPDDGYVVIAAKSGSNTGVNVWGTLLVFTVKQQILNHLRQSSFQVKELHSVSLAGGAL